MSALASFFANPSLVVRHLIAGVLDDDAPERREIPLVDLGGPGSEAFVVVIQESPFLQAGGLIPGSQPHISDGEGIVIHRSEVDENGIYVESTAQLPAPFAVYGVQRKGLDR